MSAKSAHHHFDVIDILIAFISLGTFALDVGSDLFVCVDLLVEGHNVWGWLMAGFIFVPALLMNAFSISWHVHDKSASWPVIVSHILMLAPAQRYCTVIQLGVKSYSTHKAVFTQRALRSQSDVSILRLFEAFLESAPQLVLQLYIIFHGKKGNWFTGLSAACSLVSLTWAMTAYSDSQRRAHCSLYKRRLVRLLMHYLWQLFMTSSRIAAFVFCAFALHYWVLAVMGSHWLIAFIWISIRGTDFGTDCCERWVFRLVCGFIYIFVFLNLNDGISRWRITAYYVLVLLENTGMVAVFVILGHNTGGILVAFALVYGAYMLGLVCMAVYYSYLHPSGRKKRLNPRKHNEDTGYSSKEDPHIFSIESPKLENDVSVMEGTGVDLTHNASSCKRSSADNKILPHSTKSSHIVSSMSQQALHAVWQSGMISSSSSNSSTMSLASNVKVSLAQAGRRTPSLTSVNSQASSSSGNRLLPVLGNGNNDLSKPPSQGLGMIETKTQSGNSEIRRELRADISASDNNINMHSHSSESPTFSRGSWARLSDHNRQSITLGDFTVLGFDDDSSLDRRPSDCSSVNSQPKSLSPLNVSSLLKDVHSRLRATIAATIAAATGNPSSSSEGTPNHSRSLASSVSGQEESLTCGKKATLSLHHSASICGSCETKKKVEDQPLNLSIHSSPLKREALSSLPDMSEALSPDQISDMATTDSSYERYGSEMHSVQMKDLVECGGVIEISGKSPSVFSKASYSSYPEDSTLTASKLEIKSRPSYLDALTQNGLDFYSSPQSDEPLDLSVSTAKSSASPTVRPSIKKDKQKNASPFTDQELVAVMAKSLQGYLKDTPGKSPNPEREGLALTIEDLRISRENSPEPYLNKEGNMWKSRSASSLFHDSSDTSPASSASKMNRTVSVARAEAKLSPNALKQLEVSPQTTPSLKCASMSRNPKHKDERPTSHGLKCIMDSYGQASCTSPLSSKSQYSKSDETELVCLNNVDNNHRSSFDTIKTDSKSNEKGFRRNDVSYGQDNRRKFFAEAIENHRHSFESSPGQGLSTKDLELSFSHARRTGVSQTKKLNVHHSNFPLLQYSKSPFNKESNKEVLSSCLDPEAQGYVSGLYSPPLCANVRSDSADNSIERNLDFDRRNSYDLSSVQKNVYELSVGADMELSKKNQSISGDGTRLKDMRKEVMKKNLILENQASDILHLRHSQIPHSHHNCSGYPGSQSDILITGDILAHKQSHGVSLRQTTKHQLLHSQPQPGYFYNNVSEVELQKSAKHVADYFSHALASEPYSTRLTNSTGKKKHDTHHNRSPLQQLDNAQHFSPGTSSYHKSLTRSRGMYSKPPMSRLDGELMKGGKSDRDLLRQKLSFDSEQS